MNLYEKKDQCKGKLLITYDMDGKFHEIHFLSDNYEGPFTLLELNAQKVLEGFWENGKIVGKTTIWYGTFGQISKHPYFKTILIFTLFYPILGIFLFFFSQVGVNPKIKTYGDSLVWFFNTIPLIGYGNAIPHTLVGKIFWMVFHVVNFILLSGWIVLIGLKFFARQTMQVVIAETREHHHQVNKSDDRISW